MSTVDFIDNHIFKKDFNENYSKLQSHVRKTFESTLEANHANNLGDLSCYSSDYEDEEMFTNHNTLKLWANGEELEVPADLINVQDIKDILNKEVFDNELSTEEQQHLRSLLPQNADQDKILEDLFSGKTFYHVNPLDGFMEGVKAGCFTKTFEKEQELEGRLSKIYLRNYYDNMTSFLNMRFEELQQKQNQGQYQTISNLIKRSAAFDLDDISEDSGISIESINDVKVENSLDEISEGETELEQIHEDLKMDLINEIDDELLESRRVETQKIMTSEPFKPRKPEVEPIMVSSSAAKANKASKNPITIKASSRPVGDWAERYREQETDRYNNPTRPWVFQLAGGGSAIVAPVAKKISTAQNSKPREHFLLKADRPSYITILCLVRDAAARLPNGEGTRADICELLKESQYINETVTDDKLSTVVSGALDRLHYEDDPCVKYDSDKKLWIYLHKDRTEEYGPWIDQTDSRSSKKKEYNQKYKVNKKMKAEDKSGRSETDTNVD